MRYSFGREVSSSEALCRQHQQVFDGFIKLGSLPSDRLQTGWAHFTGELEYLMLKNQHAPPEKRRRRAEARRLRDDRGSRSPHFAQPVLTTWQQRVGRGP